MEALIVAGDDSASRALQWQFAQRGRSFRIVAPSALAAAVELAAEGCVVIDAASRAALQPGRESFANGHFERLVDACRRRDLPLLLLSDSRVFATGDKVRHREAEQPSPGSAAGKILLARERYLAKWQPRHYILRTGPLIAATGTNLLTHLLAQIQRGGPLPVAAASPFCPTPVADVAWVVSGMLDQLDCCAQAQGLFHYSSSDAVSCHAFAEEVLAAAGQLGEVGDSGVQLQACAGEPWGGVYPQLNCALIRDTFGIQQRSWRRALPDLLREHLQPA